MNFAESLELVLKVEKTDFMQLITWIIIYLMDYTFVGDHVRMYKMHHCLSSNGSATCFCNTVLCTCHSARSEGKGHELKLCVSPPGVIPNVCDISMKRSKGPAMKVNSLYLLQR